MIIFQPGSHAYRLVYVLLLVGEFPFRSLGLLGDERTMKAVAVRLTQSHEFVLKDTDVCFCGRIITISGKGNLKTIRLTRYAFSFIEQVMPELFRQYLNSYDQHHFRGSKYAIDRHHRVAEAISFCLRSGIESNILLLPQLQKADNILIQYHEPAFYHGKYLKNLGFEEINKTKFTRMVGALFYGTGCYVVYNTRNAKMKWNGRGESKTSLHISDICMKNTSFKDVRSAILFGKDYDIALETLRASELDPKEENRFDYVYRHMHFVPQEDIGEKILRLITTPNWNRTLLEMIFESDELSDQNASFTYDACVNGKYILSFMDSDIIKLLRFKRGIRSLHVKWEILCFPEQLQFLRAYLGKEATLKCFDADGIVGELCSERRCLI